MRTAEEVYNAAVRAHEIARLLVNVGNAYGRPASVTDVMDWFEDMQNDPKTTAIESGLIKLSRDSNDKGFYTLYVNVGPSKDKRRDLV